jgi:hypothetical protein
LTQEAKDNSADARNCDYHRQRDQDVKHYISVVSARWSRRDAKLRRRPTRHRQSFAIRMDEQIDEHRGAQEHPVYRYLTRGAAEYSLCRSACLSG